MFQEPSPEEQAKQQRMHLREAALHFANQIRGEQQTSVEDFLSNAEAIFNYLTKE